MRTFGARRMLLAALGIGLLLGPGPAQAFEYLDGNLEIHGFFEEQVRVLGRDFDASDDFDLAQWYHVLNIEIDYAIAPDGWGPFDLVSSFARIETRFDCVWTRGCGLIDSVNTYGDRAEHLPRRLVDSRRDGFDAQSFTGDTRPAAGIPLLLDSTRFAYPYSNTAGLSAIFRDVRFGHHRRPLEFFNISGIRTLFGNRGADALLNGFNDIDGDGSPDIINDFDDSAAFVFQRVQDECIFGARATRGTANGIGSQTLGPWNPDCYIRPIGELRNKPNPFNLADVNPMLLPVVAKEEASGIALSVARARAFGSTERPLRPAPINRFAGSTQLPQAANPLPGDPNSVTDGFGNLSRVIDTTAPVGTARGGEAQGVFYPNKNLARMLRSGEFDSFDQNFSQDELQWNYGASQQNERNLKELYLDLEAFDSRLWLRVGKQNIVWGKTELFRTTDQFNPQDVALATLPSLEESRIALWSARGVWSFYEVGPFEDVRLELAFNYDQFEPADLGRCGEPFSPNPVCNKTFGLFVHGLTGLALAGEVRPPNPWDGFKGIEWGARLEWRWSRFSFQLSDFYGYNDFPFAERLFSYERNVDPASGRPRVAESSGTCATGAEAACLNQATAGNPDGLLYTPGGSGLLANDPRYALGTPGKGGTSIMWGTELDDFGRIAAFDTTRARVLTEHHANQQIFAMICSTSIGFNSLDRSVCAQSILNSPNLAAGALPVAQAVGVILRGNTNAKSILQQLVGWDAGLNGAWIDLNDDGSINIEDLPMVALTDEEAFDGTIDNGGPADVATTGTTGVPFLDAPSNPFIFLANNAGIGIDAVLSPEQEALLGCGPFYGVSCDLHGIDLLNAEASAILMSWAGFEGNPQTGFFQTRSFFDVIEPGDPLGGARPELLGAPEAPFTGVIEETLQPGTVHPGDDGLFGTPDDRIFDGGPECTRFVGGAVVKLPGCRGPADPGYNRAQDGTPPHLSIADAAFSATDFRTHPFTLQGFKSEMAAVSWNGMIGFVALSSPDDVDDDDDPAPGGQPTDTDGIPTGDDIPDVRDLFITTRGVAVRTQVRDDDGDGIAGIDTDGDGVDDVWPEIPHTQFDGGFGLPAGFFDPAAIDSDGDGDTAADGDPDDLAELRERRRRYGPLRETGCSFARPDFCSTITSVYSVTGVRRNTLNAGGNLRYGRRDFVWHGGGDLVLRYERRNVLGFSLDFAEDVTKSNWGAEFTWIEGLPFSDLDEQDGITRADTFNLTVSVDRPTFINFLNPNRTFFFNSQWFFQYVDGYRKGFSSNGPFNVLATFTVQTGYQQDRLLPSMTLVYDFESGSGGLLPSLTYRFTENFSATVGANGFWGRWQERRAALNDVALSNRVGKDAYNAFVENGLSVVRERDELYLRIRYTF